MRKLGSTWPACFSLFFIFFTLKVNAQQAKPDGDLDVTDNVTAVINAVELVPEIVEEKPDSPVSTFLLKDRLEQLQRDIPLRYNEYSHQYVDFFTERRSSFTQRMLETKDLYFPIFEGKLAEHNLPEELKYLSLIESGLNPRVVSRAGAGGLWQFMRATGREMGLQQNQYIDERFHPEKSTEAACRYLKQLYRIFGDWEMVLAAYNCGPGNIRRAIRRTGKNDFWGIYPALPRETRNYVPQFVAMVYMMHYAEDHGIVPSQQKLLTVADTLQINGYLNLRTFAALGGMSLEDIYEQNPQIVGTYLPASSQGFSLKIPAINAALMADNLSTILDSSSKVPASHAVMLAGESRTVKDGYELITTSTKHTVRSGQTLSGIAQRYGTTVSQIKKWNRLNSNAIRSGQRLVINQTTRRRIKEEAPKVEVGEDAPPAVLAAAEATQVKEENVDSVINSEPSVVAEVEEVDFPEQEVAVIPEMPDGAKMTEEMLLARQAVRLQQKSNEPTPVKNKVAPTPKQSVPVQKGSTVEHTIRRGESLISIAKKYSVKVEEIMETNRLKGTKLVAGSKLQIATGTSTGSGLKSSSSQFYHVVQSGDTLWDISRRYGLSVDKIKKANNIKGNSLKAGMKILISG